MTFDPVLPWPILAVVAGALLFARLVALRQVLIANVHRPRRARAALRWAGVTLTVLLLLLAVTRPALRDDRTRRDTTPAAGADLNVFLVVDRSAGVADPDGDAGAARIGPIRDDVAAVLKQYPGARYALVGFVSRASLDWPLSADVWSLQPTVAALAPQDARADANAGAADNVLRYQLIQATQQYPGSRNVVLYFGSGAPGSRQPQGDFNLLGGSVAGGAVLGYGSGDAIDEPKLHRIAAQLGVPYERREAGRPFHPALPAAADRAEAVDRTELYWLPALVAAVLLLAEIYLSIRQFRRGRLARRDLAT